MATYPVENTSEWAGRHADHIGSNAPDVNLGGNLISEDAVNSCIITRGLAEWSVVGTGAAAAVSASKAAGAAGVKHVVKAITYSLASAGTVTPTVVTFQVKDGTTVIWAGALSLPNVSGTSVAGSVSGLNIVGTAATALNIVTDVSPGSNVTATITVAGISVS